jgi:hypothetical protein
MTKMLLVMFFQTVVGFINKKSVHFLCELHLRAFFSCLPPFGIADFTESALFAHT